MITVVDLFAGAGGSSLGATLAGCKVVWAGNHWPTAVAVHTANFPGAEHVCQDLRQFNFASLPDHDLLSASPACQGHAKARGKDRGHVHDESRATAWAVIDALEAKRPRWFVVENVPEFLDWSLYPSWLDAVHRLGYKVSPEILNAADYGVPQTRTRLYLRGQRRTVPRPMPLSLHARELVPASRILDMNKGKFRSVVGRVQKTQDWIKQGRAKYGDVFLLKYYGQGGPRPITAPLGTVTTRDRHALVRGNEMRMLKVEPSRIKVRYGNELKVIMPGYDPMMYRSTLGDFEHYFVQAQSHGSILNRENQSRAVAYVQRNPGWRLSVQAHKILNIS